MRGLETSHIGTPMRRADGDLEGFGSHLGSPRYGRLHMGLPIFLCVCDSYNFGIDIQDTAVCVSASARACDVECKNLLQARVLLPSEVYCFSSTRKFARASGVRNVCTYMYMA